MPHFFLADTAWNGPLKASESEWDEYLSLRAAQGFTAIQFVPTQWRGCTQPPLGKAYEEIDGSVVRDEAALNAMDSRIQKIVDHGLVPVPVMFWLNNLEPFHQAEHEFMRDTCCNPLFSESAMVEIGKDMLHRWRKFSPIWLFGGDGDYRGQEFTRLLKRVANEIFENEPNALASIHPGGGFWHNDSFAEEPWFNVAMIQSGHREGPCPFLTSGPYTSRWRDLEMPFLNTEPYYERMQTDQESNTLGVRRAAYWSVLGAPVSGIAFGTTSVWAWLRKQDEQAENHSEEWTSGPWLEWMESEGTRSLLVLKQIITSLPWTELRPADHLLANQPGYENGEDFIKAAATEDESLVVVYKPGPGCLSLLLHRDADSLCCVWIDPRTGSEIPAKRENRSDIQQFTPPDDQDWLLVVSSVS